MALRQSDGPQEALRNNVLESDAVEVQMRIRIRTNTGTIYEAPTRAGIKKEKEEK